jgi:3-hydroxyisobutyrate dehydrogenase
LTDPAVHTGRVAFIGLGMMGLPMASRLVAAGFSVRGSDLSAQARASLAERGGAVFDTPAEAAAGVELVITMLPEGRIVHDVLLGSGGVADAMAPGGLVVDMSSSAPLGTRALAADLAGRGLSLIDAPVSGGVRRAADGTLAIMAGGEADTIEAIRPVLERVQLRAQADPLGLRGGYHFCAAGPFAGAVRRNRDRHR